LRCDTHCCPFSQQSSATSLQLPRCSHARKNDRFTVGSNILTCAGQTFLAPNQGACQASFFSPDPLHLLTVLSLRRSRSMLNDSSTQFVAALASPVESYEEVEQTSTNCPSKISRSIPQPPCLRLRLTVAQSFSSQAASTRRPNIILVYLILPPFITIPTTYSSCSTSSHFISGCVTPSSPPQICHTGRRSR
jgi:hypothetical protein